MLRLREIKKKGALGFLRAKIWPPAWEAAYDLPRDARADGILVAVRRIEHRLWLTVRYAQEDYVALLDEWNPPPTIDHMEVMLRLMLGKTIQAVGQAEIGKAPAVLGHTLH
jgi:hypothetical protein